MRRSTKAVVAAVWTGALILTVVAAVDVQERQRHENAVRQDTRDQLDIVRANLDEALDRRIALAGRLVSFVALDPDPDATRFQAYAATVAQDEPGVRSLRLTRADAPALVYPSSAPALPPALQDNHITETRVVGPYGPPDGLQTLVVSAPVPMPGAARSVVWGTAHVEVYLEPLYGEAKIAGWPGDARFAVRGQDGAGAAGGAFFGDPALFSARPETALVSFPGGQWQVAAAPTAGWPDEGPATWPIRLGGGVISVLAAVLVGVIVSEPDRLRRAVVEATHSVQREKNRFRTLAEAAFEGIAIHDRGRILEANTAFGRLFGHDRDQLIGTDVLDLVAPASRDAVASHLEEPSDEPYEIECRRRDGSSLMVEVAAKHLPLDDRTVRVVAVRDITERKKAEAAQRVALERLMEIERLKEVDQFKTRLLNTASHELNTPITPIRLQLYLLKNRSLGSLSKRHLRAVDVVDRNVERLALLVQDVLDVARLEGGQLKMHRDTLDLRALIGEAVEAFEEPARLAGLQLTYVVGEALPVDADRHRLTQVLFNLLSNALKFTAPGGVVRLVAGRERDEAVVRVEDNGAGLTQEQCDRLFLPFSQVHDTMEQTRSGTGLGLYISKGIVEEHGGRVWVDSPGPGRGATFGFAIPLMAPAQQTPTHLAKRSG